jgi:hypothetical protein
VLKYLPGWLPGLAEKFSAHSDALKAQLDATDSSEESRDAPTGSFSHEAETTRVELRIAVLAYELA